MGTGYEAAKEWSGQHLLECAKIMIGCIRIYVPAFRLFMI